MNPQEERAPAASLARSGFWFLLVGGAAALTHLGLFVWLSETTTWWPEVSNAAGFVIAFGVSFTGHRWLSFSDSGTPLLQSLWRFGTTALAGFACNEAIFIALHRWLAWPSLPALIVALIAAAAQTFVLGRFWAFRR